MLAMLAMLACSTHVPGVRRAEPSGSEVSSDESSNDQASSDEPKQVRIDEARLTAGSVNCPPYQIAITDSAFAGTTGSWVAHCRNFCTHASGETSCKKVRLDEPKQAKASPAASSSSGGSDGTMGRTVARSARPPAAPEPLGSAGFELGATLEATEAACTSEKHTFTQEGEGYACSGTTKSIGLPAEAHFRFCDGKVCSIEMLARPSKDTSGPWISGYARLSKALTEKYGSSNLELRKLPEPCRDHLVDCLDSGEAEFAQTWIWSSKMRVVLAMDRASGEPAIRLVYKRVAEPAAQTIIRMRCESPAESYLNELSAG